MTNIVPISDLKNYSEVLSSCDNGSVVYLTRNGRGKYVVQSMLEYEKMGHRDGLFCPSPASLCLHSNGTLFLLIPADTGLLFPVVHAGYFPMAQHD